MWKLLFILLVTILLSGCGNESEEVLSEGTEESNSTENVSEEDNEVNDQQGSAVKEPPVIDHESKITLGNESQQDESLVSFLNELNRVIQNKDVNQLLTLIDTNIKIGKSVDRGKEAFIKMWGLDAKPNESELWKELNDILELGGGNFAEPSENNENTTYIMPYQLMLPEGLDPFIYGGIIAEHVNFRDQPSLKGKVLGQLSHNIVKVGSNETGDPVKVGDYWYSWTEVTSLDGIQGYIAEKFVRSPLDYRLSLVKESQMWKISSFVSGN